MKNKTKQIHFRLSEEEFFSLKAKSQDGFQGMTHYIQCAVREFSKVNARQKIELAKDIAVLFKSIDSNMAHIGGNLNQAMHRCNELALQGKLTKSDLQSLLLPVIESVHEECLSMRNCLRQLKDQHNI